MKRLALLLICCINISFTYAQKNSKNLSYFPPAGNWQTQTPAQIGLNAEALQQAIDFAKSHEVKASRKGDIAQFQSFGKEPFSDLIGPVKDREGPAGLIIYKGYIVA